MFRSILFHTANKILLTHLNSNEINCLYLNSSTLRERSVSLHATVCFYLWLLQTLHPEEGSISARLYRDTEAFSKTFPPPPNISFSVYSPEITIYSCASRAVTLHLIIQNLFFGLVDEVVLQRQCNLMNLSAWKVSPRI